MTETPQQEQQQPDLSGIDREALRDYRPLRRSTTDRKVAGVAGGLGRHLNVDPVILRVLFVVLCFFGGAGFVLYGAMWLLVPEDDGTPAAVHTGENTRNALVIAAGLLAALLLVGDGWGRFGFPWPLVIIALVVFAILMSRDNGAPAAPAPPAAGTPYPWQPVAPPPQRSRRGPVLFGITVALIALACGALGLYEVAGNHVADAAYPALALAIIGAMLVVGAFVGRAGGLVLLGIAATVALLGAGVAGPRYHGDRDVQLAPTSAQELDSGYHVPAGRIELDLSHVRDLGSLDGRTVELDENAGEIVVIVPEGLAADVDARVHFAGAIDLPSGTKDGFGPETHTLVGGSADPTIHLDIDLNVGHIEVRTAA